MNDATRRSIQTCRRFIDGQDDALALPEASAQFCHAMVLARGAKRCLEIGTSYGYSALWIASAMAEAPNPGVGSRLITIDHDPCKTQAAREHIGAAGLADRVEFWTGTALDLLADRQH